jgi:hypothetical protein
MLASILSSTNPQVAGPAMVAFAGHTLMGGEACTCGCPNCICDSGESPNCSMAAADRKTDDMTLDDKKPTSDADYGTAAMVLALALFVWLRLRT